MRSKSTRRSARKSSGSTLIGLFVGLVIGVLIAAAVVWYIHRTPAPFTNKSQPAPASTQPAQPAPGASVQPPLALPGKPGDPIPQAGERPRFDFYKILPGNSEAIPEPATDAKASDGKAKGEAPLAEALYLQTGSFQNAADADSQKAKLALLGAEAAVQQVMLQDKVWYRVRLGPFKKLSEVNSVRADLARQGIEANVVKKD
jgi:cell division protein FtsN